MIIPDSEVRLCAAAADGEARVMANRATAGDWPVLIIIANGPATMQLLEIAKRAIEHSEGEEKEAWRGLALTLTSAIMGAVVS